jgi:hypothetical protein
LDVQLDFEKQRLESFGGGSCAGVSQSGARGKAKIRYIFSLKIHTTKWEEEDSPSSTVELTVF